MVDSSIETETIFFDINVFVCVRMRVFPLFYAYAAGLLRMFIYLYSEYLNWTRQFI